MAGEWREVKIEDIASRIAMGPFGSDIKTDNFVPSGVPVIRGNNLTRGRFREEGFVFLTEEKADELANANAFPGDIVITHRGTLGQVGLIPNRSYERYVVSQSQMKLTCDPDSADANFIYYFLISPIGQNALLMNTSQTGVPAISRPVTSLKAIRLALPPLLEQRAIAHILGTLDDKIEINRLMNETLEGAARALFKSWFVDFDPVRAKMDGSDPGIPQSLASLYPDSLQDSDAGEIPKGWRSCKVADLCEAIYSGGTPSTQNVEYWDGDVPWLSSGETREKFIIDTEKRITEAGVENSSTRAANARSTVIASAGQGNTRGQTSLLAVDCYVNQSVVVLRANPKTSSPLHLFFDLERRYEQFRQVSDGHSSRGSLTTKLLAGLDAVLPPFPLVQQFENTVSPLIERAILSLRESKTLAALRDALLPKLISGELRIAGAERLVA